MHDIYDRMVAEGVLNADPAQEAVLPMLEDVRHHLEATHLRRNGILGGLFHKPEDVPQGLYLWGGVGRGKSMLMDLFVSHLGIERKRRVHFHAFMQEVHDGMHRGAPGRAPKTRSSRWPTALTEDLRLLALDEMQITDITDAMIVGRLFEKLFAADVVVVTTSQPAAGRSLQERAQPPAFPALHRHDRASGWWCTSWSARPTTGSTGWSGRQTYFTPLGPDRARRDRGDLAELRRPGAGSRSR